jgi:hypothetical protein
MQLNDAGPRVPPEGRRPPLTRPASNPRGPSRGRRNPSWGRTGRRQPILRWEAVASALLGGLLSAVLGTALHGSAVYIGGAALPVGAAAALLLAGSVLVWCGLWARNVIAAALCGGTAYVVVAVIASSPKTLILTGTDGGAVLPAVMAGNLWLFGLAAVTVGGVAVCAVVLRKSARAVGS